MQVVTGGIPGDFLTAGNLASALELPEALQSVETH